MNSTSTNTALAAHRARPPDWEYWSRMAAVELWQAIALTLNREPRAWRGRFNVPGTGFGGIATILFGAEATDRIIIAQSNLGGPAPTLRARGSPRDRRTARVDLHEFAVWAVSVVKFDGLPLEFVALAHRKPSAPSTERVEAPTVADAAARSSTAPAAQTEPAPSVQPDAQAEPVAAGALAELPKTQPDALPDRAPAKGREMKRSALIDANFPRWESIERDLKDAAVNGLATAKARHGHWWEGLAMAWAEEKGKVSSAPAAVSPGMFHRMQR